MKSFILAAVSLAIMGLCSSASAASVLEGKKYFGQEWIFHPPFHRDAVKFKDLLLSSTSKFLQQIARFQLSGGVTDGKSYTTGYGLIHLSQIIFIMA